MRIVIIVESGPEAGRRWLLRMGDKMVFGRTEQADIVIAGDPQLSGCHFRVSVERDICQVEDLQSTNGTQVNDRRIKTELIGDGDRISAGQSTFFIQVDSPESSLKSTRVADHPATEPEIRATDVRPENAGSKVASEAVAPAPPAPPSTPIPPMRKPTTATPVIATPAPPNLAKPTPPNPARTAAPLPPEFCVRIQQCQTGLLRATQATEAGLAATDLVAILSGKVPARLIVDFARTGIDPAEIRNGGNAHFLIANLPEQAAQDVSPRMVRAEDVPTDKWLAEGWGKDGIVVLLTHVDAEPILAHFQALMSPEGGEADSNQGMLGLCWASVLESILSSGQSDLAAEIVDPCEAILLESPQAAGGWAIYGNDRLLKLLEACRIAYTQRLEPEDSDA